jgi:hypothetical protein
VSIEEEVQDVRKRVEKLEACVDELSKGLNKLIGSADVTEKLLKYVILPLLIIVGGLVGIKIAFPTS